VTVWNGLERLRGMNRVRKLATTLLAAPAHANEPGTSSNRDNGFCLQPVPEATNQAIFVRQWDCVTSHEAAQLFTFPA
jgi:hypothetical protein